VRLGLLDAASATRLNTLIARAGLPVKAPPIGADAFLNLMRLDKKAVNGDIRFVVLEGLGKAVVRPAPADAVRDVIDRLSAPF
jgi:3-dehydroquinate synthase